MMQACKPTKKPSKTLNLKIIDLDLMETTLHGNKIQVRDENLNCCLNNEKPLNSL